MLLEDLEKEKQILNRDNITLEIEINNLREIVKKLNLEYENGILVKNEICETINNIKEENNKTRENFYIQNILETLEKKLYNIKQMALIKEQSIIALEIIRRNNKEIIRNLDGIKNVTIVALNTAVTVARSLYKQKIVLNKIQILEKETGNLIHGTATVLKKDGENIYKSAINGNPEEALKLAFANAYETFNKIDTLNKRAFPENETQIIELRKMRESYE